ncbi:hypothetical protein GGR53DRAFT_468300 [Hypoxylon sp. FL1150]|nr:hypothetical protein GGR53DRAFT_468300 [Hypoxylon sp. FL1150]
MSSSDLATVPPRRSRATGRTPRPWTGISGVERDREKRLALSPAAWQKRRAASAPSCALSDVALAQHEFVEWLGWFENPEEYGLESLVSTFEGHEAEFVKMLADLLRG